MTDETRVHCDDFSRDVCKIAVGKMCKNVGFEHVESSAIETMSDLVTCFLEGLGRDAKSLADTCGREKGTIHDVLKAYCKMNPKFNLYHFGNKFLEEFADNSFGYDVKSFPLRKTKTSDKEISSVKNTKSTEKWPVNAPKHLPALPHPRTYKRTEVDVRERNQDDASKHKERLRQNRQTQMSLNRLKGSTFSSIISSNDDTSSSSSRKRKWGAMDASSSHTEDSSSQAMSNKLYSNAPTKRLKEISESAVQKGLSAADKSSSDVNRSSGSGSGGGGNRSKHELVISGRYTE